jgi:hypothetical protein
MPLHPALARDRRALVCGEPRCGTVLAADAEVCDECGGTALEPLDTIPALLCGWAEARPVVFRLSRDRAAFIGRSAPGAEPVDIDLRRLLGSASVHRRHARLEPIPGGWQVTHLGTNPLIVDGRTVDSGASAVLPAGGTLYVGAVPLQLVINSAEGI